MSGNSDIYFLMLMKAFQSPFIAKATAEIYYLRNKRRYPQIIHKTFSFLFCLRIKIKIASRSQHRGLDLWKASPLWHMIPKFLIIGKLLNFIPSLLIFFHLKVLCFFTRLQAIMRVMSYGNFLRWINDTH